MSANAANCAFFSQKPQYFVLFDADERREGRDAKDKNRDVARPSARRGQT